MFKNLTIGKRVGLGLGAVMTFLVALGVLSYWGIGGIVRNARGVIAGNEFDTLLAQREVDHLNWANQVSKLLTDETCTQLAVETDDHKCAFGEWLDGAGRKEAERAVPALAPLLKEIEQPHADLHKSAVAIGETFRREHAGLRQTLANQYADHVTWVMKCSQTIANELSGLYAYQATLRNAVDQARSVLVACAGDEKLGDTAARQKRALEILRSMRYGPEGQDYVWVNDTHPRMVLHPYKPELEGQDLTDYADPNGKKFFVDGVKACQAAGSGFVLYQWPKPGSDKPLPKISYMKLYQPWNWVVGSGVYLDETNAELLKRADDFVAGRPFTLGVETDPTQCAFGKFLADPATAKISAEFPEFKAALDACVPAHQRLHQTAVTIQQLMNELKIPAAMQIYRGETQTALAEVKQRLDDAAAAETRLTEASAKANAIYAQQTKGALVKVQDLLQKARKELKANVTTDQTMLAAAQTTQRYVAAIGGAAIVAGALLAFFIARGIVRRLTTVIGGLNEGAEQVHAAAAQVTSASQTLAEGAGEQAASLEETSSALEQMAAMTRANAENARQANALAAQARQNAGEGERTMTQLNTAVTAINESSGQISKIIKVIEEIAFQTNLLALNAAVEAARAGEHGKGFAVVAEEVRNLAQRSAQAARDTTNLIEGSVQRAKEGTLVAASAGQALQAIVTDVAKVADLLNGITQASNEQAQGVEQINSAVSQMDKVTQQNAAGAEESASAAEQLSAQAQTVKAMVGDLVSLVGGKNRAVCAAATSSAQSAGTQRQQFRVDQARLRHRTDLGTIGAVRIARTSFAGEPHDEHELKDF